MNKFKVLKNEQITEETFMLRFDRPLLEIKSGQCFNLGLPEIGINREYSMYSSEKSKYLDFLIRAVEDGIISSQLQRLQIGEYVDIDGPYGEFCIQNPNNIKTKYLFIGTGTGIAPFHSFIKTYPKLDYKILHGVRYEKDQYHNDHYPKDRYSACISKPDFGSGIRVTDKLEKENFDSDNMKFYLCGNKNMIADCLDILHNKNVSGDQIITEVFF